MTAPSAQDVARSMADRLRAEDVLFQEEVVDDIEREFGSEFIYDNENGNPAIDRRVLEEFRRLTPDAVWDRSERCWRHREPYDEVGSRAQF